MANSGEVETVYDTESEESVLMRRRREASDDDDENYQEEKGKMSMPLCRSAWRIDYADESDGDEGAPEYYDNYDTDEEVSFNDELETLGKEVEEERLDEVAEQVTVTKQIETQKVKYTDTDNDAFVIPRTGAFYMHDDRFSVPRRDQRRKKNFWEPKDKFIWVHDKFQEMTMEERHANELNAFEVQRTSVEYRQGCYKNNSSSKAKESRMHPEAGNNSVSSSNIVRGRGPVRYKPLSRSSVYSSMKSMQLEKTQQGTSCKTDSARVFSTNKTQIYKSSLENKSNADSEIALSTKGKQPAKPFVMNGDTDSSTVFSTKRKQSGYLGTTWYAGSGSTPFHCSNTEYDSHHFDQHLLAPYISSYQEAFYSASSAHQDNHTTSKSMALPGSRNFAFPSMLPNQIIHAQKSNGFFQGNFALDIPYANEGVTKSSFMYSVPGYSYMAFPESRDLQIDSSLSAPFIHRTTPNPNQLNRVSYLAQHSVAQQVPVESKIQPPSQVFTQQLHSGLGGESQRLLQAPSLSFYEPGLLESLSSSNQSKAGFVETGGNIIIPPQHTGFQREQNFNATPVLFPVMQAGGLHHGRLGSPAIDTTCTGYIGDSQVHFRNPNLTCYPTATSITGRETGSTGPSNRSLPSLGTDYVKQTAKRENNKYGKQQFKTKRYSRKSKKDELH